MAGTQAWSYTGAETASAALAVLAVMLLTFVGFRAWKASRTTPEERERRRRALLAARGKISDAILVEVRDNIVIFTYDVRGMEYTASQDVSALKELVPQDVLSLGSVAIKYLPENPANSIVLAESWSGLRAGKTHIPQ